MEDKHSLGFLSDLADSVATRLRRKLGMEAAEAADVGMAVAEDMRRLWGGLSVYICKGDAAGLEAKYGEIFEAYLKEGFSLDLCRRYDLSEQRVRQIVAHKRRARRQKAEPRQLLDEAV